MLLLTTIVALSAAFALSPLQDAATGSHVAATLHLPATYILLAPWSELLDSLSLLSTHQHVAFGLTIIASTVGVRWWKRGGRAWELRRLGGDAAAACIAIIAVAGLYTVSAIVPRPMAALSLNSVDQLAIDFHSHTNASHDARKSFTLERNQSWHRDAGFDVVFVTDHPPRKGQTPPPWQDIEGERPVMLRGAEEGCGYSHYLVLGTNPSSSPSDCACVTGGASASGSLVTILALPDAAPVRNWLSSDVAAVELVDASPRGLEELDQDRAEMVQAAWRNDVPLVAGSNNHGWGRTAAAWSVMTIPGWRSLDNRTLQATILSRLARREVSTEVISRRRPLTGASSFLTALTVPALVVDILFTMSPSERLSSLAWMWSVWWVVALVRSRRASDLFEAPAPHVVDIAIPAGVWTQAPSEV